MHTDEHPTPFAWLSLVSIALTVLFASATHAFQFGIHAIIAGFFVLLILGILNTLYQRTKNNVFLIFYELLIGWIVIGFGIVNGFWNHALRLSLYYLHGGMLPPPLAKLFPDVKAENFTLETLAILTFIASIFAAYYGFKLIPKKHMYTERIY
ncbi:MAG: hypothetical protein Q8935_00105 [Bacillota bacterium]|nr:hypothetical protein [Bacillota bacterium]